MLGRGNSTDLVLAKIDLTRGTVLLKKELYNRFVITSEVNCAIGSCQTSTTYRKTLIPRPGY